MTGNPNSGEITLAAAIRRYFEVVLYLLIFTGFGTLASTGALDSPTVLLVSGALLFRGYVLARRRQVLLSERWTNLLTIACFGFFVADEFFISRTFLPSAVHLVLFVMLVRLFSAQKDRDHYVLAVLSFLMVLSAAVLTVDSTFLIALGGFVLVAVTAFILMEMMHVQIADDTSGSSSLKLRGVVLDNFDGRTWANTFAPKKVTLKSGADGEFDLASREVPIPVMRGRRIEYRVTLEPFLSEVFFL